eukprot:s4075_g5.t1
MRQHAAAFQWLKQLVVQLPPQLLEGLVAHRGFHCPQLVEKRPLECTLPALTSAWDAGVKLCECDVRLSSDGEILLFHDEALDRLTAKTGMPKIAEMTAEELMQRPLLQGACICTLEETLQTALRKNCKLVIELKGFDDGGVGSAVAVLLSSKPELLGACALVMSFELEQLQGFALAFEEQRKLRSGLQRPQLLLLTCVPRPGLEAKYQTLDLGSASYMETVMEYLERKDLCLDGFYMEWTDRLTNIDKEALCHLCRRCTVGVWQRFGQTDCEKEAVQLMESGVTYCNSDLPEDFLSKETGH